MAFVSKYLIGAETSLNRSRKNQDDGDTEIDATCDIFNYISRRLISERADAFNAQS